MKFNDLDKKMRVFEQAHDFCVLPGIYMVARLDGRGFTKFANQHFERPFDIRFRDFMIQTTRHLMSECGFHGAYGYTESDEISILFPVDADVFNRKVRKLNSVLAGEASSVFTLACGERATFDCRISQLPTKELVLDYFRWRAADSLRNSLNTHICWTLRNHNNRSGRKVASIMADMNHTEKKTQLAIYGVDFDTLPVWQKHGIGFEWESVTQEGYNPKTKMKVAYTRKNLLTNLDLPSGENYAEHLKEYFTTYGLK